MAENFGIGSLTEAHNLDFGDVTVYGEVDEFGIDEDTNTVTVKFNSSPEFNIKGIGWTTLDIEQRVFVFKATEERN